eukprot:CAMPEP_0202465294 /NCGR_PEP_ID=MMETSP1360-20130828/65109_1 /ASSEMBLY_ACC=CAM_ASM_000848 /TAXON_ID=515479 /ORGANISM="Licmophora paradoxa, Strain CCMP2313" /LENGTH=75 /DNA_ID=CAMNT_0049088975 /DNA_START=48 /DNA_END=271 /DNA_ORIENTATION=-
MASMDESMKALSCSNPNPSTKVHARHRKEGRAMTSKKDPNDQHKHSKRSRASTTTSEKKREKRKAEIKRLILESR